MLDTSVEQRRFQPLVADLADDLTRVVQETHRYSWIALVRSGNKQVGFRNEIVLGGTRASNFVEPVIGAIFNSLKDRVEDDSDGRIRMIGIREMNAKNTSIRKFRRE